MTSRSPYAAIELLGPSRGLSVELSPTLTGMPMWLGKAWGMLAPCSSHLDTPGIVLGVQSLPPSRALSLQAPDKTYHQGAGYLIAPVSCSGILTTVKRSWVDVDPSQFVAQLGSSPNTE